MVKRKDKEHAMKVLIQPAEDRDQTDREHDKHDRQDQCNGC